MVFLSPAFCELLKFSIRLRWFASEAIKRFPPSSDGVIYVIGDGSHRDKRGKKHPATQKGKQNKYVYYVYFFGIKFIVLMVSWDTYRIPVDFEIVLPKPLPGYQNENTLFRQMVARFCHHCGPNGLSFGGLCLRFPREHAIDSATKQRGQTLPMGFCLRYSPNVETKQ